MKENGHTDRDGKLLLLIRLAVESTAWSQVTMDFPLWVLSWMGQTTYPVLRCYINKVLLGEGISHALSPCLVASLPVSKLRKHLPSKVYNYNELPLFWELMLDLHVCQRPTLRMTDIKVLCHQISVSANLSIGPG